MHRSHRALATLVALALTATPTPPRAQEADPLAALSELTPGALLRLALARNSAPAAAEAAAQAATEGVTMAGALMDPMLTLETAPQSYFTRRVPLGVSVKLSQRLPFPGKRGLREAAARHEAQAQTYAAGEARLTLREAATRLFVQLHLAERALAISDAHERLLLDLQGVAEARAGAGTGRQADALQVEVMRAELAAERLELEARRRALTAQVNGLLHRAPQAPLPPTPEMLALEPSPPVPAAALEARPELAAMEARVEAADARVQLAHRAWLPDFELMASYGTMWMEDEHRFMVGLSVELPLQQAPRRAQVAEAEAMARRMRYEQARARHEVASELEMERQMLAATTQRAALLRERLLPAARSRLESLRAAWIAGRAEFEALIEAERSLRDAELKRHEAEAEVLERRASLERLAGVLP